jgi:hypothetical protein
MRSAILRSITLLEPLEFFAVYCSELNKVYLVPIDHAGKSNMQLRLAPKGTSRRKT